MKVYSLMNQKGGVGKSSISVNLAHGLQMDGFRVLLVDTDAQRNATQIAYAGFPDVQEHPYSTYDIFYNSKEELQAKGINVRDMIIHTENCDLIPASTSLSLIDTQIAWKIDKDYRLAQALAKVEDQYDFAIIDAPPALGTISINVIVASDGIIIPALTDYLSLTALGDFFLQVTTVNEYIRKEVPVRICGILFNNYVVNSSTNNDVDKKYREAAEAMNLEIFTTKIRRSATIDKALKEMENLWTYTNRLPNKKPYVFNGVIDFYSFINELLIKEGIPTNGKLKEFMVENRMISPYDEE